MLHKVVDRSVVLAILFLITACRSTVDSQSESKVAGSPEREPVARTRSPEDYVAARKAFRSHLVKHGPPPQTAEPLGAPADAREVSFESGGLKLTAWVSRDDADSTGSPHPAILYLHGGFGFDSGDWAATRPFRDAGFLVMAPILRGENGQPGEFSAFYNEVDDVVAAADTLARQPGVDTTHIYVAGHSVGGTLTMFAALASTRFRAAAAFSGAPDQGSWIAPQLEIAPYDTWDEAEYRIRSPLAFATSFKCPVRLYWGDGEPYFTESTRETARRAKAAGLDVDAVQVKGNHGTMVGPASQRAIEFFREHR
jgi:dipeptidyl aminopeptidase/acylaminoacyl peptidase